MSAERSAASPRGLTIDCGEGKHDVCCGFGTSSYLIPQTAGERFECACPCHDQPAAKCPNCHGTGNTRFGGCAYCKGSGRGR